MIDDSDSSSSDDNYRFEELNLKTVFGKPLFGKNDTSSNKQTSNNTLFQNSNVAVSQTLIDMKSEIKKENVNTVKK